ncbi:hypothetical protein D3C76_1597700 [compost metagenome]
MMSRENAPSKASRLRATDCTEPNTTWAIASLRASPAAKMSALSPQASYLAWFCSTSSLTWASTSTRPRALRASSAITRLLPAPVGSTTTAGSGCLRKWLITALTASV